MWAMINKLRIIAGKWRGRKISFSDIAELRPTPDRVRETLFNWLAPVIVHANCLDLFSGSGALGFEALSRGAKHAVLVDESSDIIQQLNTNQKLLSCENIKIIQSKSEDYLKNCGEKFDLVFLDPPFQSNLIQKTCDLLAEKNLLNPSALIYIETSAKSDLSFLPDTWNILKEKQAGQVRYYLVNWTFRLKGKPT